MPRSSRTIFRRQRRSRSRTPRRRRLVGEGEGRRQSTFRPRCYVDRCTDELVPTGKEQETTTMRIRRSCETVSRVRLPPFPSSLRSPLPNHRTNAPPTLHPPSPFLLTALLHHPLPALLPLPSLTRRHPLRNPQRPMGRRCRTRSSEGVPQRSRHPPHQVPPPLHRQAHPLARHPPLWTPRYRKELLGEGGGDRGEEHVL